MRYSLRNFAVVASLVCTSLTASLYPSSAWAFWFGSVPSDNISLKEAASDGSRTLEILAKGSRFTSTDQPVNGYYRIRTKTNTGYIDASVIDGQNPKQNPSGSPVPDVVAAPTTQPTTPGRRSNSRTRRSATNRDNKWSVTLLAGVTLSNPSDVSTAIGSKSLANPLGLGLEIAYRLRSDWRLAFRGQYLSKGLTGADNSTSNTDTYQLNMKGYMFTVGADYFLTETRTYDIFVGARAGLGMGKLSSLDTTTSYETDFSASTLAGNIALGADYKAWSFLWFGLEGGYQLFKTGDASPVYPSIGNANTIWPNPVSLSYSGVYMDLNLRVLF